MTTYVPIPTITTGDTWTAAMHNQYVRDNLANTPPAVFTAKGDLVVGAAASQGAIFGVGSNKEYSMLRHYTGAGSFNNFIWSRNAPSLLVYLDTQSIPDNTLTQINLTANTRANPSTLPFYPGTGNYIIPTTSYAGIYHIYAQGYFDASGTAGKIREISITSNIKGTIRNSFCQPIGASVQTWVEINVIWALDGSLGEQLSVNVFQVSGGALNFRVGKVGLLRLE